MARVGARSRVKVRVRPYAPLLHRSAPTVQLRNLVRVRVPTVQLRN